MSEGLSSESETGPSILKFVRSEMGDTFSVDSKLLDKFFPVESVPNSNYLRARKKLFNEKRKRWKHISATPAPMSRIYRPLTNILNTILSYYEIDKYRRKYIDVHLRRHVEGSEGIMPGICLAGVGKEFTNSSATIPQAAWITCISVFEVVLDSDDMVAARDRLAVHMHQIFRRQDSRRFAFGVIITPNEFTLHMFDYSGVVSSDPCNYHLHPERFCAVVSGLAGEFSQIGFSYTMVSENVSTKFRTYRIIGDKTIEETQFFVQDLLFHFPSLVGRGTLCWLARRLDDCRSAFVIKDAWISPSDPPGRESEASLMRHAQSCGITTGIAQIIHFEEVRRSEDPADLDTVLRNRKNEDTSPEILKLDRVHTRLIMSSYGRPLDEFLNIKELLFAFHDAVLAHRKLHDIAGILHRDISFRNILINPDGVEGDRGILIDFDHSIRIDDTSPYSTKGGIGTWRFMSRRVIQERVPHTYFDDLESFYYVLCYILGSFKRVGVIKQPLPPDLIFWDLSTAAETKGGYLADFFELPISSFFGTSLPALASRLHSFFYDRIMDPPVNPSSDADYDEYISHIRQAVVDFEAEERGDPLPQLSPEEIKAAQLMRENPKIIKRLPRKKPEEPPDEEVLYCRRLLSPPTNPPRGEDLVVYGRPRRSTAHYAPFQTI